MNQASRVRDAPLARYAPRSHTRVRSLAVRRAEIFMVYTADRWRETWLAGYTYYPVSHPRVQFAAQNYRGRRITLSTQIPRISSTADFVPPFFCLSADERKRKFREIARRRDSHRFTDRAELSPTRYSLKYICIV